MIGRGTKYASELSYGLGGHLCLADAEDCLSDEGMVCNSDLLNCPIEFGLPLLDVLGLFGEVP